MMKKILMAGIAMLTIAISSCDENTSTMGYSLTSDADRFSLVPDTFLVSTRSLMVDSVLARSSYSYLGCIKDPETGTYIGSDFTTQINVLENDAPYLFAAKEDVSSLDADGEPIATSCQLNIIVNSYLGDSLTSMKLMVLELDKPIEDNRLYYSNFDPEAKGYIREDGLQQAKVYSMTDMTQSDSMRYVRQQNSYYPYISIPLNKPYKAKNGVTYNNYGTYLMRTYYEHPEYFKNGVSFINKVCPGFYIMTVDGQGVMAEVLNVQLVVNYKFKTGDTEYAGTKTFFGTEEVLQTTHIGNDKNEIQRLVDDNRCTYLKTPAGIFTEVTLPVDEIKKGHDNDSIISAKIIFQRMADLNSKTDDLIYDLTELLMVERDSLYTFFEKSKVTNNRTSFLAVYNAAQNTYSFNNISSLINHMDRIRSIGSENWNKVVLIPVKTTTSSTSSYSTTVTGIDNQMAITSTRLVGGSASTHGPVRISVIYNQGK